MKKSLCLLLALILMFSCALAEKEEDNGYLGTWYLSLFQIYGQMINPADYGDEGSLIIDPDGSVVLTLPGAGRFEGTWQRPGEGQLILFIDNEVHILQDLGDVMQMQLQEGEETAYFRFTRHVPTPTPAFDMISADSEESFFGTWQFMWDIDPDTLAVLPFDAVNVFSDVPVFLFLTVTQGHASYLLLNYRDWSYSMVEDVPTSFGYDESTKTDGVLLIPPQDNAPNVIRLVMTPSGAPLILLLGLTENGEADYVRVGLLAEYGT